MSAREIFISHANADKALADSFVVELLETGIGVAHDQVFCTSLEGQGIPPGKDFKHHIREQLADASCVIALITPSYYESTFCICELGATWVLTKHFIPVLVPPVTFADLRGVLQGTQCLRIDDERDLDTINDALKGIAKNPTGTARWNTGRANFLKTLKPLLNALKQPTIIKPGEFAATKKGLSEYKALSEELDSEVARQKKLVAEISALKDRAQVARVKRKHSTEADTFEDLVSHAKQALRALHRGTKEALYYWFRYEDFYPAQEWSENVDLAHEHGEIKTTPEGNTFSPNQDKPIVQRAIDALEELRAFEKKASSDFHEAFEEQYGDNFDPTTRDFWDRFFK